MADPTRRPRSVTAALLTDLLTEQLLAWQAETSTTDPLHIVDLGGGTGGLAAGLAGHGHRVTVVDPSPDALASLDRRAADAGLGHRLTGLLGDAAELVDLIGAGQADVVVCHSVLEFVDDPAEALAAIAATLRPVGLLSLLVGQRPAAVLAHALSGHLGAARAVLADAHRFDRSMIINLVGQSGFQVVAVHGIGAVASLVHESLLNSQADAWSELHALERDISSVPDFQTMAPQLHVSARRADVG